MVNREQQNNVCNPLVLGKSHLPFMKVRDHVNMSVTVSIAVFHSSDKLFEENTVRNIKEKYSGLCVGDKSLASQY